MKHQLDNIVFITKIIYHQIGDESAAAEGDDEFTGVMMRQNRKQLKMKGRNIGTIGFDDLGDLRVGTKEIIATYNEQRKLMTFCHSLKKRINQINMIK